MTGVALTKLGTKDEPTHIFIFNEARSVEKDTVVLISAVVTSVSLQRPIAD